MWYKFAYVSIQRFKIRHASILRIQGVALATRLQSLITGLACSSTAAHRRFGHPTGLGPLIAGLGFVVRPGKSWTDQGAPWTDSVGRGRYSSTTAGNPRKLSIHAPTTRVTRSQRSTATKRLSFAIASPSASSSRNRDSERIGDKLPNYRPSTPSLVCTLDANGPPLQRTAHGATDTIWRLLELPQSAAESRAAACQPRHPLALLGQEQRLLLRLPMRSVADQSTPSRAVAAALLRRLTAGRHCLATLPLTCSNSFPRY